LWASVTHRLSPRRARTRKTHVLAGKTPRTPDYRSEYSVWTRRRLVSAAIIGACR
jgi:hypothetical protein